MLQLKSVSCAYDGVTVLAGATLDVGPGEFVAIAGPNGSGKTTLLRTASRALKPRTGSVLLEDRDLYEMNSREAARAVAVVPQDSVVEFDFTAEEIVLMGRHPHLGRFDAESSQDRDVARRSMERTRTWELRDRPMTELSGGERRRVLLARAVTQEAKYLLLDEPTTHLDVRYQVETLHMTRDLAKEGHCIVAVLHDLNLAAAFATRIVFLKEGAIVADGPPAAMLTQERLVSVFGDVVLVRDHPDGGPLILPRLS